MLQVFNICLELAKAGQRASSDTRTMQNTTAKKDSFRPLTPPKANPGSRVFGYLN